MNIPLASPPSMMSATSNAWSVCIPDNFTPGGMRGSSCLREFLYADFHHDESSYLSVLGLCDSLFDLVISRDALPIPASIAVQLKDQAIM